MLRGSNYQLHFIICWVGGGVLHNCRIDVMKVFWKKDDLKIFYYAGDWNMEVFTIMMCWLRGGLFLLVRDYCRTVFDDYFILNEQFCYSASQWLCSISPAWWEEMACFLLCLKHMRKFCIILDGVSLYWTKKEQQLARALSLCLLMRTMSEYFSDLRKILKVYCMSVILKVVSRKLWSSHFQFHVTLMSVDK